jgi:hypothetical protein
MRQAPSKATSGAETPELIIALEAVLGGHFGMPRRITCLHREAYEYGSSFTVEAMDVTLDDGARLPLVFKDLSRQALLESARTVKPHFLYDPLREIETYRRCLAPHCLGTARYYGSVVDPQAARYWLFLEHVAGESLWQIGDFAIWQQAARWLAGLHRQFASETQRKETHWLRYDGAYYRTWMRRALSFVRGSEKARRSLERLADSYETVIERLLSLPTTWIHGEFYASNVLVQRSEGSVRICPVDWEMAAVGPGLMDLAALAAGKWSEEQKTALALAYRAALCLEARQLFDPAELRVALDLCTLHCAVQWLGWSAAWSPPPEHSHDWLGEAVRLADKLDL